MGAMLSLPGRYLSYLADLVLVGQDATSDGSRVPERKMCRQARPTFVLTQHIWCNGHAEGESSIRVPSNSMDPRKF